MKIAFVFLLLCGFQTVFAQEQPVEVLNHKWFYKIQTFISSGNSPFNVENPQINIQGNTQTNRQTDGGKTTYKYFVYRATLKNISDKHIIGITWDYVFFDNVEKIEKSKRSFNYVLTRVKKNKKVVVEGRSGNPPEMIVDVKDYEKESANLTEFINIKCVVFEDRTTWKKEGVDEKICENLRIMVKTRQEVLKRL